MFLLRLLMGLSIGIMVGIALTRRPRSQPQPQANHPPVLQIDPLPAD